MDFGRESGKQELAEQILLDYRTADLDSADRLLCDYAVKLTLMPGAMNHNDVDRLRDAGFAEEQINIAVQIVGYFNYINRVADGLGVDLEPWMTLPEETWRENKGRDYSTVFE